MSESDGARRADWAATRLRLRTAARELFGSRGYRGTTTRQLAEQAGVSLTTLHRHFPRKIDLFEDAVLSPIEEFIDDYLSSREQRGNAVLDSAREMTIFFDSLVGVILSEENALIAASLAFSEH